MCGLQYRRYVVLLKLVDRWADGRRLRREGLCLELQFGVKDEEESSGSAF